MRVGSMGARFDFVGVNVKLSSPLQEYMEMSYWPCPKNMIQLDRWPLEGDYTSRWTGDLHNVWFHIRDTNVIDMGKEAEFKEIVVAASQSALNDLCDRPELLQFNAVFNDVRLYRSSEGYTLYLATQIFALVDGG